VFRLIIISENVSSDYKCFLKCLVNSGGEEAGTNTLDRLSHIVTRNVPNGDRHVIGARHACVNTPRVWHVTERKNAMNNAQIAKARCEKRHCRLLNIFIWETLPRSSLLTFDSALASARNFWISPFSTGPSSMRRNGRCDESRDAGKYVRILRAERSGDVPIRGTSKRSLSPQDISQIQKEI